METITKTYNVYEIDELNEETKGKVLERFRHLNVEGWQWWHAVYDQWQEKLAKMGYNDVKIEFSGFWSQGDGASFTADIDLETWLKSHTKAVQEKYQPLVANAYEYTVTRDTSHYVHENTCRVEIADTPAGNDTLDSLAIELQLVMEAERLQLCKELYKDLEQEYEYHTSDDAVTDTIRSNEYRFLADGTEFQD